MSLLLCVGEVVQGGVHDRFSFLTVGFELDVLRYGAPLVVAVLEVDVAGDDLSVSFDRVVDRLEEIFARRMSRPSAFRGPRRPRWSSRAWPDR
ncbi:hypothetical protein LUW77_00685 [Streptomyces radiopugnans]|nr:hypothetical protein LUW77_00685 [Streptomyces radiopugnans]